MLQRSLLLRILFVFLILSSLLAGEEVSDLKQNGSVNDYAGVIDASSRQQLEQMALSIWQHQRAVIVIVTIKSLESSDIESFTSELFKQWRIGPKNDQGVLILVATGDHKYRVEVGYGLEAILPDGKVGAFGREVAPLFKERKYGSALLQLTGQIGAAIATTQPASTPPAKSVFVPDHAEKVWEWTGIIFWLFVGVCIIGFGWLLGGAILRSILMHTSFKDRNWVKRLPEFAPFSSGNPDFDSSSGTDGSYGGDSFNDSGDSGGSSGGGGASGDY